MSGRAPIPGRLAVAVLVSAVLAAPAAATAQEDRPRPRVTVEAVTVEPEEPGPDTLCRLTVTLRNRGDRVASQLGFAVTLDGQALPVYGQQLFHHRLEPGATAEVPLYNFWTTETSRPAPADGKLTVAVTLEEARWVEISEDDEGVEVLKLRQPVAGLPSAASVELELAQAP